MQHAVGDVRPQLFVIGIGKLVIDDLGQDVLLAGEGVEFIEFLQTQHRRLFDEDVLAREEAAAGGVEVAIVRRGDADDIDLLGEQVVDGVRAGTIDEGGETIAARLPILFATFPSAAGDGGEFHVDIANVGAIEALGVQLLEDGAIGFVEDHAEADHADAEMIAGKIRRVAHG